MLQVSYTSAIAAIVESCPVTAVLLTKQANTYYVMFLGETGSGKSTLLNMFVNFFRGPAAGRTSLPKPQDIKAAVPTAHVAVTEPEGARHSERNTQDSEFMAMLKGCIVLHVGRAGDHH